MSEVRTENLGSLYEERCCTETRPHAHYDVNPEALHGTGELNPIDVGDRVAHRDIPDFTGDVIKVWWYDHRTWAEFGGVGLYDKWQYPTEELEVIEPAKSVDKPKVDPFEMALYGIFSDAHELLLKKHKDYGPKNIALSPGGPLNGLRVRIWDKLARINHLIDSGAEPENESLRDSFIDALCYSAIALMVLDKQWPGVE